MPKHWGIIAITVACLMNLAVGLGFYYARQVDSQFSPLAGVLVRILANIPFVVFPLFLGRTIPRLESWRAGSELWLWGFFGVLTVLTYYESITIVGGGRANLLSAGTGLFITVLAPTLTGQPRNNTHILGAIGCLAGVTLLSQATWNDHLPLYGLLLALASGIFSALAYLMVARGGTRHTPESVALHWTFLNVAVVGTLCLAMNISWPMSKISWMVLLAAGVCAAASQYFTTIAYRSTGASLVACLSFLTPLLGVPLDKFAFGLPITPRTIAGMMLIVFCGLMLPFLRRS